MINNTLIAGVDEAGRGPLAGPVFAAAVILEPSQPIDGITDSKKLSAKRRDQLFDEVQAKARAWAIASASAAEIDSINILQASMLAMQRAVQRLVMVPNLVLVDGNKTPNLAMPCRAIIKGDLTEPAISAASILAKVARDRLLLQLDAKYPEYGFAKHKGYPTKQHLAALKEFGVTSEHRRSFAPVRNLLELVEHE